ncbi:Dabb domain containing protein [Pyrenophora tritici-repentis]|nr:Dabb domain containing protein [Pyrenophora tritici-repentis]KAI0576684.1 Dabb domain-containing protein [Pyrenophora tritici-repentis]KAI0580505.1 Dabb domain-containing protein [Pyrenophora tritici-repentis]KAI0621572.1 hypothetical protein TUN199_06450 [Pyrenophora tritici-repentis]PWO24736.1 GltB, Glutamate synthase domain 2 [Pyrenophora tritici-repentis]
MLFRITSLLAIGAAFTHATLDIDSKQKGDMEACSSPQVTRIATFRFKPDVTAEQKGDRAAAFMALYAEHPELLAEPPKGGRPLDTPLNLTNVKRESIWDMGFTVMFKDEASRQQFDLDPGHDRLKNETDPLLEQVFVYDFIAQPNLGC